MKELYFEIDRNKMTSGSVAYDLSAFAAPAPKPRPRPEHRPAHRPSARPQAEPRPKAGVPLFAIFGMAACVVLAAMVINTCASLNEINDAIVTQQRELSQLRKEAREMAERYNIIVDLEEVEHRATSELGMVYPEPDQMVYLDLSRGDDSVSYQGKTGPLNRFGGWIKGILG